MAEPHKPALRILNVDDNPASRYTVSRILKHNGFEVMEAESGRGALALAREQPDLVVLDVQLPDINGMEVCQRLKSDPATASIPVLQVSSTYVTGSDQAKGLNLGADAYLTHPVDASVLVATVKALVRARQAERSLAAEMERLAVTLKSIGDAVITTDAKGNVELMNRVAETLTGWSLDEARERPLGTVLRTVDPHSGRSLDALSLHRLEADAGDAERRVLLIDREEGEKLISENVSSIEDSSGRTTGFVVVFRDITAVKRTEEEMHKAQKLESLGVLAGGIAHDFNNILTAILGNLSLARLPDADTQALLSHAESACLRARHLTQQLLTFARGGEPIKKPSQIQGLLSEMAELDPHGGSVQLEVSVAPDLWTVDIDAGQIAQALNNLVVNAKEAMPAGGKIAITACNVVIEKRRAALREGRYVRIAVRDQGTGIAPKHLSRIFDPYFTTKAKGSGLGLAGTYSIVKRHGGHIEVQSKLKVGSDFVMYLPACDEQTARAPVTAPAPSRAGGRVLVMDDEPQILTVMRHLVAGMGYSVECARNGAEAIEKYEQAMAEGRGFAVAILDLTVHDGMGGMECLQKLKALDPGVTAVVASGYSNDPIMSDPQQYGFAGVIAKPFRVEELSAAIAGVLKARS